MDVIGHNVFETKYGWRTEKLKERKMSNEASK